MTSFLRSVLGLAIGVAFSTMIAAPAFASPQDTMAALQANAADLYDAAAANAAELRANLSD